AFYLLTGRSYWLTVEQDGTEAQLFAEILSRPLLAASLRARQLGVAVELTPPFDGWFLRCVNRDPAQRFKSAGQAAAELARALGVPMEPPRVSEAPRRSSSARQSTVADPSPRGAVAQPLETHELAALSTTSGLTRPSRARAGWATLLILLAGAGGAGAVVLWRRASLTPPTPSSISASPTPPSAQLAPTVIDTAPPPAPPRVAVDVPPAVPSARPIVKPAASAPPPEKRGVSPVRPKDAAKTPTPSRDLYEQR
ncbi:MAG TPA: hypothetical protein VEQ58_22900, partial [Polyangiaceae bacterium]|nr:hypothetical protein [Polyangiaceae bacterium]